MAPETALSGAGWPQPVVVTDAPPLAPTEPTPAPTASAPVGEDIESNRTALLRREALPFRSQLVSPPPDGERLHVRFFNQRDLVAEIP